MGQEAVAPAVEVQAVGVQFGGVNALSDVTLTAGRGQVVGLIGPNGAGKTTLFDVISGLCKPWTGTISFEGLNVTDRSAVWRARWGLRRTFQRQQVFGRLSVEDNLLTACEWRSGGGTMMADLVHWPSRARLERVRRGQVAEVLELCGLTTFKNAMAASLPIGIARLLELGRALIDRPKVLLLDEPTSGLGHGEVEVLQRVLAVVREAADCAVLLVEHDTGFVMSECAYVYVLAAGSVLASGTPAQVREDTDVQAAYLG